MGLGTRPRGQRNTGGQRGSVHEHRHGRASATRRVPAVGSRAEIAFTVTGSAVVSTTTAEEYILAATAPRALGVPAGADLLTYVADMCRK